MIRHCCTSLNAATLLLAILAMPMPAGSAPLQQAHSQEASIMQLLRDALHMMDPVRTSELVGWAAELDAPHCTWQFVQCNAAWRVREIVLPAFSRQDSTELHSEQPAQAPSTPSVPASVSPLLPELAQLEWLGKLHLGLALYPLRGGIPEEWVQPGSFPRLQELWLTLGSLERPLPDILPGALPSLKRLLLTVDEVHTTLPASWAAHPATLPSMRSLSLSLPLQGTLPAGWAHGFRQLTKLEIQCTSMSTRVPQKPAHAGSHGVLPLPQEWASGFPQLAELSLLACGPGGSIPASWSDVGLPTLTTLDLHQMQLTGTLPGNLLKSHPRLAVLSLEMNNLSGTLPDAWADSQVQTLVLSHNNLSGPAFPESWMMPGAFSRLRWLSLEGISGLTGTLPAYLSWANLEGLNLQEMPGLTGTIPETWCQAAIASSLRHLWTLGSGVDPTLPACAARSLPHLRVNDVKGGAGRDNPSHEHTKPQFGSAPTPSAAADPAAVLLLLLLLLVAVVATVYVAAVWRQHWLRCKGRHGQLGAPDTDALLLLNSRSTCAALPQGRSAHASVGSSSGLSGGSSVQPLSQRARLAAMLRAQLGSQADSLRMLPVEALPEALAHHLGSAAAAATAAASGWTDKPARQQQLTKSVAELKEERSREARPLLHAGGSEVEMSRLSSWGWRLSSSSASSADRQWGLETDSLLVPPGELTLVTGTDGQLIELGAGTHGVVFLGRLQGTKVAVKVYELQPGISSSWAWQEAKLLRACTHPHIVPLLGVAFTGPLLLMAMEWMQGGSLHSALQDLDTSQSLAWERCGRQVVVDIAEAVAFMHGTLQVLHGDLKASNVLLSRDMRAHVADLGIAKWVGYASGTAPGGTYMYAAPEQLMGRHCTLAADIYSLGILLIKLTTRELGSTRGGWRLPTAPDDCPQEVVDLIVECIRPEPGQRPTAAAVLERLREAAP